MPGGRRTSLGLGREGSAEEAVGDEQHECGEGEFEGALGDLVGDDDADQHAERREGADHGRVAQVEVAVAVLSGGADQGDDDDHQQRGRLALDLAEAEEDRQRRDEEDAPADADQAAGEAAGGGDQDRDQDVGAHPTISSIATPTSSTAKSSETARCGIRCWTAVPITTPSTAGIESSRPVPTWTLP